MKDKTVVVNCRTVKSYDVYIGRPSIFGNPFSHIPVGTLAEFKVATREEAIEKYREYFLNRVENDPDFRKQALALKGQTLACFCKPLSCHGDVIKEWLDGTETNK